MIDYFIKLSAVFTIWSIHPATHSTG